ncbi:MAG: gfo/Idh/MocA family oxidoreductase [Candidatus Omnitrophica bacterium]|nr:gfo/Idh/MocA family oxidoreductase [Candidatus Omnitrophota bacterium]MBD3268644.1 gfo/Idh/MocA family oxidoreductase [Candidatus Omnitrophota bacterium]
MRVGIIGIGKLGGIHLRIYKELKEIKKIYLADTERKALSPYPEFESFKDYRELKGKVDLVSIAAPTVSHFRIADFFLKNHIPALVEKPLTSNLRQARKLVEISLKNKTLLMVGHVERYNSAYLAIKKLIKNPLFIECHRLSLYPHRSLDISVILDLMIHDLDIILDLVRDEVSKIEAKGVKVISADEDIANVRLTFKKGCVANITASRISAKKERKIRIFMPNCYVSLDYARQGVEIYKKNKSGIVSRELNIKREEPLKREIALFVKMAKQKKFEMQYCRKAMNALSLGLKIQKKIKASG